MPDVVERIQTFRDLPKQEFLTGGTSVCAGCGAQLGLKLALKVLGKNTVVINASGCLTLLGVWPVSPFKVPYIHLAIENAGAVATGIHRALRAMNSSEVNILCYAGDGATYDIGLQALSGAVERDDDFLYICYNNESFANTGMQRSSSTPYGAWTTTTPAGKKNPVGNLFRKKPLAKIMAAHDMPYVATANVAYPLDYIAKLEKAKTIKGPKFIDLLTPCQPGWGVDPSNTIEVGRMATECGIWPLYEIIYEDGFRKFILNERPKLRPVQDYFSLQQRFKHLTNEQIQEIQHQIKKQWKALESGSWIDA